MKMEPFMKLAVFVLPLHFAIPAASAADTERR
jgi:hypothetical protein